MNSRDEYRMIDGVMYVSIAVAARFCGVAEVTMLKWRKEPNAPPWNSSLKMYPVGELGEWCKREQIYKMSSGRAYPYLPDFGRFPERVWEKMNIPALRKKPVVMSMPGGPPQPPDEDQKERYERLRADKLEFQLKRDIGTYVLADDVVIAMTSMVSRVKTRLLALSSQLSMSLASKNDPLDCEELLEKEIRIALEELNPDWAREHDIALGGRR